MVSRDIHCVHRGNRVCRFARDSALEGDGFELPVPHEIGAGAPLPKRLGVARQPFEQAQLIVEFRARRRIAVRQIQASDEQAADGRLDVAAMRIIRSPGGLRRVSTGSAPRARTATPFQLFCPARPRRTDTRWAGPLFARICPSRRLNKATIFC